MPRPIKAVIKLEALRQNLNLAVKLASPGKVMAVVKADAYGHGLSRLLPALGAADALALLEIEGALSLRDKGYSKPLIMLEGFFDLRELEMFSAKSLTAVIHDPEQLEMLISSKLKKPINIFLKMNSGMNRLGFTLGGFEKAYEELSRSINVDSITAMTHFADAEGSTGVEWQLDKFNLSRTIAQNKLNVSLRNSSALLRFPKMKDNWSRPGIMLYGANPVEQNFDNFDKIQLKPVMSLKSKIISCQALKKGDTVGYGCDYVATEDMSVGIVACGYGDGYPRSAPTGTPVMLGSHRTSVIGRVSMDMIALDLRGIPNEALGEDVLLWGQSLPIELIAKNAGTISYELFCRVNKRINFSVE